MKIFGKTYTFKKTIINNLYLKVFQRNFLITNLSNMDLESRFVLGTWAQLMLALVNLIHQNRSALKNAENRYLLHCVYNITSFNSKILI